MYKKIMIIMFMLSVASCANTMEGLGADIEEIGKTIKDAGRSNKDIDSN